MMLKKLGFLVVVFCWFCSKSNAQTESMDYQLGYQYYQQGEFKKSADIFRKLWNKQPEQFAYYNLLYNSLMQLKAFDDARNVAKKSFKKFPGFPLYAIDAAYALKQKGETQKAYDEYEQIIKKIGSDAESYQEIANGFKNKSELHFALKTLEKGLTVVPDKSLFANELTEIYFQQGNLDKMIATYLDWMALVPIQAQFIQNMLQSRLQADDYSALKKQLLLKVQQYPDMLVFSEMLVWYFVQQKDFESAFEQAKALDKRQKLNGSNLLTLARIALDNKQFNAAKEIYAHIMGYGIENPFYVLAYGEYLKVGIEQLAYSPTIDTASLKDLKAKFSLFFDAFGVGTPTVQQVLGWANLNARYLGDVDTAIAVLEDALDFQGLSNRNKALVKLDLGDYYVIAGEMWEPALLFGQVEKDFKDDPLGQEARFKNARLSFYRGDFELAQAQMDVLKSATSQFISNDALQLSLLIQDNLGMDSMLTPMQMYARADLLLFQSKYTQAKAVLDSLLHDFPGHSLTDEVLFLQGKMAAQQKNYQLALQYFEQVKAYNDADVLADDALFQMAEIQDLVLKNKQAAMELYGEIINKYPNSTYAVEARKQFRILRGEKIN